MAAVQAERRRLAALARPLIAAAGSRTPPPLSSCATWREWLLGAGWLHPSLYSEAAPDAQDAAVTLLSSALTFPLTLAHGWERLGLAAPRVEICIVGARAEASLPPAMWQQLSALVGADVRLRMVGPGIPGVVVGNGNVVATPSATPSASVEAKLFHETALGQALLRDPSSAADVPDAFVCFNPGLGEPGWGAAWEPTMRALAASRRPLLMTALSRDDAARDAEYCATHRIGFQPLVHEPNPWASLLNTGDAAPSHANAYRALPT